jgi:hypothetical protein
LGYRAGGIRGVLIELNFFESVSDPAGYRALGFATARRRTDSTLT